jgi:hypothetical protein
MAFWRKTPEPDSVRIGRIHEVPAEVHYSSGSDRWWYHGPICLTETRSLREEQFSPHLQDPRNRPIVEDLQSFPNAVDEDVAKKWKVPVRVVKEIRIELERRAEPHVLRVYTLKNATKRDERILGTIDQDLFAEAPSVPYSQTEKGARRLKWAMLATMLILDSVFLFAMFSVLPSAASSYVTPQELLVETQSTLVQFGLVIAIPSTALGVYVWMARRTLVADIDIQPVLESVGDTHAEVVFLVRSQKTPASSYLTHLFHLRPDTVRELTEEFGRFQTDLIGSLQDQVRSLHEEIDEDHSQRHEQLSRDADRRALGYGAASPFAGINVWAIVLVVGVAVVVAVVGTYVAVGG